jgi:hypothetical protein
LLIKACEISYLLCLLRYLSDFTTRKLISPYSMPQYFSAIILIDISPWLKSFYNIHIILCSTDCLHHAFIWVFFIWKYI